MSRYKAYSSYKETRHSWLESVPAHWKMLPLKFLTAQHVTDGPHETPEFIDEGVPFLSVDGIQNNQLVFEGCRYISREDHARYSIKCKPNQGDVLLGKAASVGKVAHVDTDVEFNVWSPLAVIRPRSKKTGRFIYYSLQSALLQMQCDMYSNANTQKNLGMSTIDNLAFASPTDDEAEQIAYFLDHETAKIEALIEKQQRLIELLKEKRQAVISHAVTKGLNPSAPMKDSGVEWLGEVPAHWISTRLKYLKGLESNSFVDGPFGSNLKSEHFIDDGVVYVIESTFATTGQLDTAQLKKISLQHYETIKRSTTKGGDIIIAKIGARYGSSSILPELDSKAVVSGNSLKLTVNESLLTNEFANELLRVLKANDAMDDGVNITAQPALSLGGLNNLPFLRVPLSEQHEIVKFIKEQKEIFEGLIEKAALFIEFSIERRTALISAAVTGKIDVRDWQAAA